MVVDLASGQTKVGRFGWKAQHATLVAFVADAFRNEMGIPSDMLPQEYTFGFTNKQMRKCNPVRGVINRSNGSEFVGFLPARSWRRWGRGPIDEAVRDGDRILGASALQACHVAMLETGPSSNPLFNRQHVPLSLGSSPARHWHRRWDSTGRGEAGRDSNAGALGITAPASLPPRRKRRHD